jgi:peptide subunit release factor 1 (eRF1)
MVIHDETLKQLVAFSNHEHPVISLYLNVTPPRPFASELNAAIHAKKQQLKASGLLSKDQLRALEEMLARLQNYAQGLVGALERTRLLVLFASPEKLWQEFRLPVALPTRLVIDKDPYIRPLTALLEEFRRYCVLLADARKARLFSLYLGDIEEHLGLFVDDVPSKVKSGGWAALQQTRIQRHIEDHIHRHLKQVAERAFQFFQEKHFDFLILGGPQDKTLPELYDHLHSYLQARVAGEFHAEPESDMLLLKEKALAVAQAWERKEEARLIDRLLDVSGAARKGVLGLEAALEALMLGQVHTLVIQHDFQAQGLLCPDDHSLSTYLPRCPVCGRSMEPVTDLVEEMVEEAITQGAELEHVFAQHYGFSPHGVGALLRFAL